MNQKKIGLICACAVGFAYSCNYTNHAPLIPILIQQFGFTKAMAGLLTTAMFFTHAAVQIPSGHLADKYGGRNIIGIGLMIVIAGNVGITFSNNYIALLLWKTFVGFGTGTSFIAGARYISQLMPAKELPKAQGYFGASILLGSGFVIFIIPRIAQVSSWQTAFLSTGSLAAFVLIIWFLLSPKPVPKGYSSTKLSVLLLHPQLWVLGIVQMASFGLVIVIGSWITLLLKQQILIAKPLLISFVASLVILIGVITRPVGGVLVTKIGARKLLQISFLLNTIGCLLLAYVGSSLLAALLAIVLLGIGCGLPYATIFNRATVLFPGRAGAAKGLVNMIGVIMIMVGTPLVGYVVDSSGQFTNAFIALAGLSLVVFIISFSIKNNLDDNYLSI